MAKWVLVRTDDDGSEMHVIHNLGDEAELLDFLADALNQAGFAVADLDSQ